MGAWRPALVGRKPLQVHPFPSSSIAQQRNKIYTIVVAEGGTRWIARNGSEDDHGNPVVEHVNILRPCMLRGIVHTLDVTFDTLQGICAQTLNTVL